MFHGRISLSLVLLLQLLNFVSGSRLESMYYIPYCKYQVKTHSSPWFSATRTAAIAHRNHCFRLFQQNKSSESKVKFRQASNHCKTVHQAVKFTFSNKAKESATSQKRGSPGF